MEPLNKEMLIAPCGINCGLCMAYLRTKNHCPGCQNITVSNFKTINHCSIRNCEKHIGSFCDLCDGKICLREKGLDKRYRTKYNVSPVNNLKKIQESGLKLFLKSENKKWTCPECGGTICVHRSNCSNCGKIFSELPLI